MTSLYLSRSPVLVLAVLATPLHAEDRKLQPVSPKDGVILLFNGKDLTGLRSWLRKTKGEDPRKVFTVHDGMLHISGGDASGSREARPLAGEGGRM